MAVIVKNTFLDVAEYKFLYSGERFGSGKRCCSVPKTWKPTTPSGSSDIPSKVMSSNDDSSPRSDISFQSALESMEHRSSSTSMVDLASSWDWGEIETDVAFDCMTPTSNLSSPRCGYTFQQGVSGTLKEFACPTPTSPQNSPRCNTEQMLGQDCWGRQATRMAWYEAAQALQCNTVCNDGLSAQFPDVAFRAKNDIKVGDVARWFDDVHNHPEPENEPEILMETEQAHHGQDADARTRLKVEAPVFQPVPKDTRMEAVISCLHLALFSSGQVCNITIENSMLWNSATVVSAEVPGGADASSRSYNVMQLTKHALEAITDRLPTVTLLSARVQKEDCGYSLRSSVACLPQEAQNCMCWDMYRKGHCPRRSQCRWYHPQESDVARIRVSVKYAQNLSESLKEQKSWIDSSLSRHKISLGELVP